MLHVEARFPAAFYAPARWGTADGCMPFKVCLCYFEFLHALTALDASGTARAIGVAFGGSDDGASAGEALFADAFPRAR